LAESRSNGLTFLEEPILDSIPGLSDDLDAFVGSEMVGAEGFLLQNGLLYDTIQGAYPVSYWTRRQAVLNHFAHERGFPEGQGMEVHHPAFMEQDREVTLTNMARTFWWRGLIHEAYDKDKDFLEHLKPLLEEKELTIDLKKDGLKRLVLRQNYGDKVEKTFNMSRQGVRWRFHRLFNGIYVEAYEIIFWVESQFGTELRQKAMEIARERVELRKKVQKIEFVTLTV